MKLFDPIKPVSSISEKELISRIRNGLGSAGLPPPFGSGDDCALIDGKSLPKNVFFTVDSVIAGVHFPIDTSPRLAAEKLVKRNVSDVASMGGRPIYAIVACAYSKLLSLDWLDEFCRGLRGASLRYGLKIVGGDMASVDKDLFSAELSLLGGSNSRVLTRTGASVGDSICVTGSLGLSFESGKHLSFNPRVEEGEWLARQACVSACIDLSDGFASDVKNMLPLGTCALVKPKDVPRTHFNGREATIDEALCQGEDYELCFTTSDSAALAEEYKSRFSADLHIVGKIERAHSGEEGAIVLLDGDARRVYSGAGWSH